MQVIIIYAVAAVTTWLLVGIVITCLFVINRPKGVRLTNKGRLWAIGAVFWPYLVALMFDRR